MKKTLFHKWLAVTAACTVAVVSFLAATLFKTEAETTKYAYNPAFQDNFDGTLSDGWAYVAGGRSYQTESDGAYGWRFDGGENHIAYKTKTATDFGKFLYGDAAFTDYAFEVKMRADVNETLGEYMTKYSSNVGAGLTLNTNLPFFVTDPTPDTNLNSFRGRSVSISNYAIGFYQFSDENGNGWAKSVRLNTIFSGDFDWRQWHTIRVEASATGCNLYLDDVLTLAAAQSDFAKATATSGYCGISASCPASYSSLHFDDFRVWTKSSVLVEKEIAAMNAADFKDKTKTDYQSASINTALLETEKNALVYNTDAKFGTDIRLLNDYTYQSFEITAAFDIENQKAAKEASNGALANDDVVKTSGAAGLLFNGSNHNSSSTPVSYHGYMLKYYGVEKYNSETKRVEIYLMKYEGNTTFTQVAILGRLIGQSNCIINAKVENGTLSVAVYKTAEDLANGNKATLTNSSSSVTAKSGVYSIALPDYNAETGGDYTEGQIGFWCNSGGTATRYVYEAEILSFSGITLVEPTGYQPVEEEAEYAVNIAAATGGAVKVNGDEKTGGVTAAAHSDVQLSFVPAEGYYVADVKIDGVSLGGTESFVIGNITKDYAVQAIFERKSATYTVEHYIEAAVYTGESDRYTVTVETLEGYVGDLTAATAKTLPGITARGFAQETIAEGGGTAVAIYYDRENSVQANIGADTFYSIGASVRLEKGESDDTGSGIRFGFVLEKSVYDKIQGKVTLGALLIPADLATGEITADTPLVRNIGTDGTWVETEIDGVAFMRCAVYLYGIPQSSYARGIAARGYIEADGRTYYTAAVVRSFSFVAQEAYNDQSFTSKELLTEYLPSVTFEGGGAEGETETVTLTDSLEYVLPDCPFTAPAGKVFAGWKIGEKTYAAGVKYTFNGAARVTAVAVWEDEA